MGGGRAAATARPHTPQQSGARGGARGGGTSNAPSDGVDAPSQTASEPRWRRPALGVPPPSVRRPQSRTAASGAGAAVCKRSLAPAPSPAPPHHYHHHRRAPASLLRCWRSAAPLRPLGAASLARLALRVPPRGRRLLRKAGHGASRGGAARPSVWRGPWRALSPRAATPCARHGGRLRGGESGCPPTDATRGAACDGCPLQGRVQGPRPGHAQHGTRPIPPL